MRLHIFSDVHFDVADAFAPCLLDDVDAVVVAGDVCQGIERGVRWLRHHLGNEVPIVHVAGNHEFFHTVRADERQAGSRIAEVLGTTFLDDTAAVIGGVRFVGSTLWADFAIFGEDVRPRAMQSAQQFMYDHRLIREGRGSLALFTPEDALAQHRTSRAFLERTLARPFDGPTVVVTHHGPHERSIAPKFREDLVTAAFVSDLAAVIERHQPALWIHGHTHASFDYRIGATRIVCNPHGYGDENPMFDPELVVEV
jgi:Icc-related predicted phosphoesterase